jgi:hypothetical protein
MKASELRKLESKVEELKSRLRDAERLYLDALKSSADAAEVFKQNEQDIIAFSSGLCPRCNSGESAQRLRDEALRRRDALMKQCDLKAEQALEMGNLVDELSTKINRMETEIHKALRASRGGGMW